MRDLNEIIRSNQAAYERWANDRAKVVAAFAAADRVVNAVMASDRDAAIRDLGEAIRDVRS